MLHFTHDGSSSLNVSTFCECSLSCAIALGFRWVSKISYSLQLLITVTVCSSKCIDKIDNNKSEEDEDYDHEKSDDDDDDDDVDEDEMEYDSHDDDDNVDEDEMEYDSRDDDDNIDEDEMEYDSRDDDDNVDEDEMEDMVENDDNFGEEDYDKSDDDEVDADESLEDPIIDASIGYSQMSNINGNFAPYFENTTSALLFCWTQKHNICKLESLKLNIIYYYVKYKT